VILTLHGGQNVSATDYMRQQFSEIEGLISQNHSYPLSDQPAALAQLESYRPYIGSERIDALREAIVTRPVQTRLTGYGFLNPNQIDGINGSVTDCNQMDGLTKILCALFIQTVTEPKVMPLDYKPDFRNSAITTEK
jgi:hypothetical protein